jgi:hypothetical protein
MLSRLLASRESLGDLVMAGCDQGVDHLGLLGFGGWISD